MEPMGTNVLIIWYHTLTYLEMFDNWCQNQEQSCNIKKHCKMLWETDQPVRIKNNDVV